MKITIDHGNVIYSLMFTSEFRGVFYNSEKYGGWAGGETVSEVSNSSLLHQSIHYTYPFYYNNLCGGLIRSSSKVMRK